MMDFLTPICGICGLGIGDLRAHWDWHEATDGRVIPAEQAERFAEAREALRQKAELWAEMDRHKAEREAQP